MKNTYPWQVFTVMAAVMPVAAVAQSDGNLVLEEIVVTAQKRSENLQEVPVSISAFTANTLEKKGITSTGDLSIVTPGLQASQQTGSSTPYLRGVGTQSAAAGDESSIAMYIDGVYSPNARSNSMSFNNIERIEVLKGPQGTLFGRNATGGLIHIITKDPSMDFSGKAEVSYGSYDTVGSKIYITGPLSDQVAADIAVLYRDQAEGWGENRITGSDVNLSETKAIRTKFLMTPGDSTEIKLGINYSDDKGDIGMARQVAPGAIGGDGVSTYTGDWYDVATEKDVFSNAEDTGVTLHIDHSFASFDLLSITAWQDNDIEQFMDVDASANLIQSARLNYGSETVTQEFQLTSTSSGAFNWIAGFFYMDSTSDYRPFELYVANVPGYFLTSTNAQDTTSYSLFFQGDYLISDATKVTLGLRATQDERDLDADVTVLDPNSMTYINIVEQRDEDWVEPTWRLSLDHQLNDQTLLFASYSRGFKSGVYNLAGLPDDPVDPETLDAYEVGFKSDLLASRLRLNGSVYYYDYKDVQLQRVEQGSAFLVNAAAAEIYGFELEGLWLASEALSLSAGLSVSKSEYTDYPNGTLNTPTGVGGNAQSSGDLSGNEVIRTPEFTFNLGATYSWFISAGEMVASANYYYNDGFYWEPENRYEQEQYELLNMDLALYTTDETWKFRVFGKNLMGEEYSYYGNSSAVGDAVSAAPPRTFGVSVEYSF